MTDNDLRLQRELRRVLEDRDPGPAPYGLRTRVDLVPDLPTRRRALASSVVVLGGLAAAVLLLAIGVGTLGRGAMPAPQAGASMLPRASFDPTLTGPGVGPFDPRAWLFWGGVIAVLVLVLLAFVATGWRRIASVVAIGTLVGWFVVGQFTGSIRGGFILAPRSGLTEAALPFGASETLYYVTAPPGEPFVLGIGVRNDGLIPIRITGIDGNPELDDAYGGWTAVWLDEAPHGATDGAAVGPGTPFVPIDVPAHEAVTLWLVGTAGSCSGGHELVVDGVLGPNAGASALSVLVHYDQLGWSRTQPIADDVGILIPLADPCPQA